MLKLNLGSQILILLSFINKQNAMANQVVEMHKGGGLSFWPKPILHPACPPTSKNSIAVNVRPCGFCNQGYHCSNITMTSCKHTYHTICLGEFLKLQNKCVVCDQLLHHDQWRSQGFGEEDDEVKGLVNKLGLHE